MKSRQKQMVDRIEKLSVLPGDLLIVRTREDMETLLEMTQAGIGFTQYSNPVLFLPGGLEKATEADLMDALNIVRRLNTIALDTIAKVN